MMMNFMIYAHRHDRLTGSMGFAIHMGGVGPASARWAAAASSTGEFTVSLFGKDFGLFGTRASSWPARRYDVAVFALFLFQMVFMDTAATIPTGAMAERWKFVVLRRLRLRSSAVISTRCYANWVWGGGWLSTLGKNFGLGHGHVDFAGSSVVHMVGGVDGAGRRHGARAAAREVQQGRHGQRDPRPQPPDGACSARFILAFGWFGFNPGSTLAGDRPAHRA